MADLSTAARLRQSAKELRLLPKALGDYYGPLETMRRGAEIVVEAFKAGAFRGDSPLAELGLEIRHFLKMRHAPESIAVREGKEPIWRNCVWYAAVRHIAPDLFGRHDVTAIQTAAAPVADAIDREADRIEATLTKAVPDAVAVVAGSSVEAETVGRLLALSGDGTGVKVLSIARDEAKSADERMRLLVERDRRFDGYDSAQWAELLDCTSARVRQTDFWKAREQRKEWDR